MKKLGLLIVLALTALTTQAQKYTEMSDAMENAEKRITKLEKNCKDELTKLKNNNSLIWRLLGLSLERIAGRLYYFGNTPKNWHDAQQDCISMGGDLVAKGIRDRKVFDEIFKIGVRKRKNYWIGLTDIKKEGEYVFVDGAIASTSDFFWITGEPNNQNSENCMMLWTDQSRKVNDGHCHATLAPLCEFELA